MKKQKYNGFTIVELLIVIIVIGVLAALVLNAFSGAQKKAREAAAQSDIAGARKYMALKFAEDGTYPTTSAGISKSDGTTYELSVNNTAGTYAYCLTATNVNVSYKATESQAASSGSCAGHGSNGNAAVTNFATNPSFEAGLSGVNSFSVSNSNPTVGDAYSGSKVMRSTRTNATSTWGPWWDAAAITAGKTYNVSLAMRSNSSESRGLRIEWRDSAKAGLTTSTLSNAAGTSGWTIMSGSATAPANAAFIRLTLYSSGTGTTSDYVDTDGVMITEGTAGSAFADGNTANWIWNGATNNSTSTGSPV